MFFNRAMRMLVDVTAADVATRLSRSFILTTATGGHVTHQLSSVMAR